MSTQNVSCRRDGATAIVTIDRPKRLNALDLATIAELRSVFAELAIDDEIRSAVLTGGGEKAFVAGADISELATLSGPEATRYAAGGHALMSAIENLGKPVVAAIGGFALGGGLELALACTVRWAAPNARLGLPETGLGLIPGFGGTQRLPRLIGRARAIEMILGGESVDAVQAEAWGLITRVVPQEDLLAEATAYASKLAERPAVAIRSALKAVGEGANMSPDAAMNLEIALFGVTCASDDATEGCEAFLQKRDPEYRHR